MVDIDSKAYNVSSGLFSFKEMKRNVIDYGKRCYIEGYTEGNNKCCDLFANFLVSGGYISFEEKNDVLDKFKEYLSSDACVKDNLVATAEDVIEMLYVGPSQSGVTLSNSQKDILDTIFNNLTNGQGNEFDEFFIQKPRQCGVSCILRAIAYMLTSSEKRVLYLGYNEPRFKNKFFKFKNIAHTNSIGIRNVSVGVLYDYIIVDELSFLDKEKYEEIKILQATTGAKIIYVITPCKHSVKYKELLTIDSPVRKCKCLPGGALNSYDKKLIYNIMPSDRNIEMAKKYKECSSELLGEYLDEE
jgi:hypothetical protein